MTEQYRLVAAIGSSWSTTASSTKLTFDQSLAGYTRWFQQEVIVEAFINITGKNNHIRTRVNSAPVSFHQRQRMMVEPEMPISARY